MWFFVFFFVLKNKKRLLKTTTKQWLNILEYKYNIKNILYMDKEVNL